MKILGILGSPRRHGNSELLLDEFLKGAKENGADVEKIILNELKFTSCQECGGCDKTGVCIRDDDLTSVYYKILNAQGIVIASPIFFGTVTSQIKAMMDRCQCLWIAKYVLKKKLRQQKARGFFISVGGINRTDFFESAKKVIKIFFATIDVSYNGELFFPGVDREGQIKEIDGALQSAREKGKLFACGQM
jgi:multimeric flavodoxin WrbA